MTTQNNRRRWILIGGAIVVVSALLGLYIISRVDTVVNTFFNRTDQPVSVAAHYYEAIRNQNFAAAYADLDSKATLNGQPIDEQAFINLAKTADAQRGLLFSYGFLRQSDDGAQLNASVRRGDQSYTVHLQLQQAGDRWKIVSMDGL